MFTQGYDDRIALLHTSGIDRYNGTIASIYGLYLEASVASSLVTFSHDQGTFVSDATEY